MAKSWADLVHERDLELAALGRLAVRLRSAEVKLKNMAQDDPGRPSQRAVVTRMLGEVQAANGKIKGLNRAIDRHPDKN